MTPEVFEEFCNITAESRLSKKDICRSLNISDKSIDKFIRDDETGEALRQYTRAKEDQIEFLVDKKYEIIDRCKNDIVTEDDPKKIHAMVNILKIEIDSINFDASKRLPRKYGDKLDLTSDGKQLLQPPPEYTVRIAKDN